MKKIDAIKDITLENKEINMSFEELEIKNATLEKIDWKDSKFNYLEITNSKIKTSTFSNINLSNQTLYKVTFIDCNFVLQNVRCWPKPHNSAIVWDCQRSNSCSNLFVYIIHFSAKKFAYLLGKLGIRLFACGSFVTNLLSRRAVLNVAGNHVNGDFVKIHN